MNYFDFYELPISFLPDLALVKRKYYALSKQYHPDFYTLESEEKQAEALEKSSLNNQAYRVLSNRDACMKYVLEQFNLIGEEQRHDLSQGFLVEMMEINEGLMELEFEFDSNRYEQVLKDLEGLEISLYKGVETKLQHFDSTKPDTAALQEIKDYYHKKRYLLRIRENLNKFANT